MGKVLSFPRRNVPNTIKVVRDFGEWSISYYRDQRFVSRLTFPSKVGAEEEAMRLCKTGLMTWWFGDNGTVYVLPDATDGGCWAVAHRSRSDDSDVLLLRHLDLNSALYTAICRARDVKAGVSLAVPA